MTLGAVVTTACDMASMCMDDTTCTGYATAAVARGAYVGASVGHVDVDPLPSGSGPIHAYALVCAYYGCGSVYGWWYDNSAAACHGIAIWLLSVRMLCWFVQAQGGLAIALLVLYGVGLPICSSVHAKA